MSMETLMNKLLAFGIVAGLGFIIYSKIRKQSFQEVFEDIKSLLSFGEKKEGN